MNRTAAAASLIYNPVNLTVKIFFPPTRMPIINSELPLSVFSNAYIFYCKKAVGISISPFIKPRIRPAGMIQITKKVIAARLCRFQDELSFSDILMSKYASARDL